MLNTTVNIFEDNPAQSNVGAYQPRQTTLQAIYSGQYVKVDSRLSNDGVLAICELYVFAGKRISHFVSNSVHIFTKKKFYKC